MADVEPQKRQNHVWNEEEDEKLVECLMELYQSGKWRADNGTFKSGYLKVLEKAIREKMPGTTIRGSPHIESRVRTMKKQTHAIWEMISASGFAWDEQQKQIICEKSVYDEWVKSHPNAARLREKPFPHYDELVIIFGKDRAVGASVESFEDAIEEIEREEAMESRSGRKRDRDEVDDLSFQEFMQEVGDDAAGSYRNFSQSAAPQSQAFEGSRDTPPSETGERSSPSIRKVRKKRPGESNEVLIDPIDGAFSKIEKVFITSNETLGKIANCFQHLANDAASKENVVDIIMNLHDLSIDEKMMAGSLISEDANKARYLLQIAENMRSEYCRWILKKTGN